jgi:ABC-type nitrate/sulfonate/bicarbonate transport system substrate-binding protein
MLPSGYAQDLKAKDSKAPQKAAPPVDERTFDVLKLASPLPTSVSVLHIAEKKGFFREARIKPEFVGTVEAGKQVPYVLAGKLDVGGAHVNRTIAAKSNGARITAVVAQSETRREFPHMTFAVLKDSPIRTARDLAGKKYGTSAYGGCMEYTPYDYMRLKGGVADPKGKIQVVIIPAGQEVQALKQKLVDVISLSAYPKYVYKTEPGLRHLFIDYDVWGEVGGATPLYFSNEFIRKKPDVVRRFVGAIAKTNNWINAHLEEARDITSKDFNIPKEKINAMHYAKDGIIKENSVQLWIDALNYYKEIKPGIKTADIYTNDFNPYYKKK